MLERPEATRRGRVNLPHLALAGALLLTMVPPDAAAQTPAACGVPPAVVTVSATPGASPPVSDAVTPAPADVSDAGAGATPAVSDAPPPTSPIATPNAGAALAEELDAVARALAACLTANAARTVVALATERYLGQLFGGGEPLARDAYLAIAPELDAVPVRIVSLRDARRVGETATAEVVSVVGRQLLRGRWRFVRAAAGEREPGQAPWQVDSEAALAVTPPPGATAVGVTLADYAIALDGPAAVGPDAVLRGVNTGAEDHEMLVLRFASGLTTADLLRAAGPALPPGIEYVGQATVPAGDDAALVLTGLEPGSYAIVCLFPDAQGTPHLALGMAAAFAVEAEA